MNVDIAKTVEGLKTKSAKIRALDAQGVPHADIARFLGVSFSHVRNVLTGPAPRAAGSGAGINERPEIMRMKVQIGPGGRIVIPAAVRDAMGVAEGSTLFASFEDGQFVLATPKTVVERIQQEIRRHVPEGESLVDELIADRRREAARDD